MCITTKAIIHCDLEFFFLNTRMNIALYTHYTTTVCESRLACRFYHIFLAIVKTAKQQKIRQLSRYAD